MRQKDKKLKDLIMQVEDERKQAEQYKDQVQSLMILHLSSAAGVVDGWRPWTNRLVCVICVLLVKCLHFSRVSVAPTRLRSQTPA